jgi:hypothetical protein
MSTGWSDDEIRETVEGYFEMLEAELTGERSNKTQLLQSGWRAGWREATTCAG